MGYATTNPPALLSQQMDNANVPKVWVYNSTDAASSVYAAGYFTNGKELGIKKGDILLYMKTDTPQLYIMVCTVDTTDALLAFGSTNATSS